MKSVKSPRHLISLQGNIIYLWLLTSYNQKTHFRQSEKEHHDIFPLKGNNDIHVEVHHLNNSTDMAP